ncbi:predicted protein [Sclerotinia sclerotiorum 1980 UF-70]|uniref:Uncharacterized protein n=1 Tax=Sclerotinia sclerotiorum (strain ATCC 18683 / 1980 / Ss-1) TaxID=665079 RepID=A7EXG8_SCLS1|nr:predicted protein [Sclerotinia sclerotiorum 1980 UF-70]EDN94160.1 predicted protein [Sclerotinia sclerotiorum 1980 UF-70]
MSISGTLTCAKPGIYGISQAQTCLKSPKYPMTGLALDI